MIMIMTLTEFLLARIAEDEEAARGADALSRWAAHDGVLFAVCGSTESPDRCDQHRLGIPNDCDDRRIAEANDDWSAPGLLDHTARHDPARVLAESEAKRRIVSLHKLADHPTYRQTKCCARCTADGEYPADDAYTDAQNWPCPTLRALALPYADHPDYRDEWKP